MRLPRVGLGLLLLAPAAGCGAEVKGRVSGTVTCKGKAFYPATITFSPVAGPGVLEAGKPAWGVTDETGRYTLTTDRAGDGVVVGQHRVTLNVEYPDRVPCRGYQRVQIVVEVKAGDNTIDLKLDEYEKK